MRRDMLANHRVARRGFTLVELLVAIFIIVLLAGILLPMVMRSFRQSTRVRSQADIQAITAALDNYQIDFGDIPRLPTDASGVPLPNTGAATLGKALLGNYGTGADLKAWVGTTKYSIGECVGNGGVFYVCIADVPAGTATSDTKAWALFDPRDGFNGPGFKARAGAGKTWGPYVDASKFKSKGSVLLDSSNRPILYFPARPGQMNVADTATPVYTGQGQTFKYNLADNFEFFRRTTDAPDIEIQHRMQVMLNDVDLNGAVNTPAASSIPETAIEQRYLLWASGPDEQFGPAGVAQSSGSFKFDSGKPDENRKLAEDCDDVTNFR